MSNKIEMLANCKVVESLDGRSAQGKTVASIDISYQPDLMYMQSLFVSTGENKNDDVFLPEEMWGARKSPAYKPVDWEHNAGRELTDEEEKQNPGKVVSGNQTIGVMYNTYAVDSDMNVIDDRAIEAPKHFHIIDEAVIWKNLYPKTAARIEKGAEDKTLFVSMEAWFKSYDYLVGSKVVARNEETAFLDSMLRTNGGQGIFGNSRVKRVLRGITFGGKGIVARPANAPSVITSVTHEPMCAVASENNAITNNTLFDLQNTKALEPRRNLEMSDEKNKSSSSDVNTVSIDKYVSACEELSVLKAQLAAKSTEASEALKSAEELKAQLAATTEDFSNKLKASAKVSSRVAEGNKENFFALLEDSLVKDEEARAALDSKLKDALAKIDEMEVASRLADRSHKLDSVLASIKDEEARNAKKEKLIATVDGLDDDAFNSLLETIAELTPKAEAEMPAFLKDKKKDEKSKDSKDDKSEDEDKKKTAEKKAKAAEMAELLGLSEDSLELIEDELYGKAGASEEEEFEELFKSVKSSEELPAGESSSQGVDVSKAYSGLVTAMLNSNKPIK